MTGEDDFITRLMGFGLTEKEAHAYFYLLKYGPKTPSPLAKALHTYREDMHRTLNSLIDKGMLRPSLDSPTVYAAVDLETALESALKKHESELREMEARKRELEELSRQQQFRPSDEVSTYKIIKSVREGVGVVTPLILSLEKEFLWVVPEPGVTVAALFGIFDALQDVIARGGQSRGITDLQYSGIKMAQAFLEMGGELRHFEHYGGLIYCVSDRRYAISSINVDIKRISLDESVSMLFTDDPVYADYLVSTFELLWQQSVPAEERIQELVKQGPLQTEQ